MSNPKPFLYHHSVGIIRQKPPELPDANDKKYHSILHGFDRSSFNDDLNNYYEHIASLPAYPAPNFPAEWEGRELYEGVDFKIQHQRVASLYSMKHWIDCGEKEYELIFEHLRRIVAIPIPKEEQRQELKCEGSCEERGGHIGEVVEVEVSRVGNFVPMIFNYCQAAIEEDKRRGFDVKPTLSSPPSSPDKADSKQSLHEIENTYCQEQAEGRQLCAVQCYECSSRSSSPINDTKEDDKDYWRKRCEAAENLIASDAFASMPNYFNKWQELKSKQPNG